jgi:hypothetical protein
MGQPSLLYLGDSSVRVEWDDAWQRNVPQQLRPKILQVEVGRVKVQRVSGHTAQINESFAYFTTADCMIRAMRFSIRFFQ